VRYGFGDMIFRSQRNLRYQKQREAETQHGDDESTGHERILRLIYCFSTNSPFSTARLTVVNHSRRRGLHWNLEKSTTCSASLNCQGSAPIKIVPPTLA